MRLRDLVIVVGVLLYVGSLLVDAAVEQFRGLFDRQVEGPVAALPRQPSAGDGVPDLSRGRATTLQVDMPRRGTAHGGTAWFVGGGIWLTARHVAEGCAVQRIGGLQRPRIARVWRDADADLMAFATASAPAAIAVSGRPPRKGEAAVAVGYPAGKAGVARIRLLGAAYIRLQGGTVSEQPFRYYLWEIGSLPEHVPDAGKLGGISGGVALNAAGEAVGLVFSSVPRRGMMGTVAWGDVARIHRAAGAGGEAVAGRSPDESAEAFGLALMQRGVVARVICRD